MTAPIEQCGGSVEKYMGDTVNLASRLESAAEPGTVLISHDTDRHVQDLFDAES